MATDGLLEMLYASIDALGEPEPGGEKECPFPSGFGPKSAKRDFSGTGKLAEILESVRSPEVPLQTGEIYTRESNFQKTDSEKPPAAGRARISYLFNGNY